MDQDPKEDSKEIYPGFKTVKDFTQNGFKVLVEATRNANALPQDRNFDFYNAHESFRNIMNQEGTEILRLINTIIREQGVLGSFSSRDLDEKIEVIVEANDTILERAAINLDEVNGIRKNPEMPLQIQEVSAVLPVSGSWNKIDNVNCTVSSFKPKNQGTTNAPNAIRLLTGNNIQRPQKFFKDRIDNGNKFPWEPRIKDKPNSLKPLALYMEVNADGFPSFCHPYECELDRFVPSKELLKSITPVEPKPLADTPLRMVETPEELTAMLEDLRKYNVFAVDLEHHSYRTFLGITCLMQISTGDTDYLIDTLTLRDKLCILNEVFTKPTVVKIFHGADHDVEWLQRDLSLYVVNMFDTFQAAKQLGYEQRSLAYLLRRFCQIDANKHFQLADWRIRPLPDELKVYAREDTHYLIYIYHKLRNELLEAGHKQPHILKSVIDRSTDICKKRYIKPILNETSHMELYRRCKKMFDNKQMFALKELYRWRDTIARTEDESIGYVLPNHMMLQIAEVLPREMQGVLACCNPIPPLVRANLLEIHKIILKARDQSLVKPILSEEPRSHGSTQTVTRLNVDNALNCPHDYSDEKEFRDDLPTLLGDKLKQKKKPLPVLIESQTPILDVFEKIEESLKLLQKDAVNKVKNLKFLGPFERYKLVKPFIQAEEEKKEEEKKELLVREKKVERVVEGQIEEVIRIGENKTTDKVDSLLSREVLREGESPQKQPRSRKPDLSLRQMGGCKRKRSPSSHQPQGQSDSEEAPIDQLVGPLADVRPTPDTNWGNQNRKRKHKNKGNAFKKRKMEESQGEGPGTVQGAGQGDSQTLPNVMTFRQKKKMEKRERQKQKQQDQQRNNFNQNDNQPNFQPNTQDNRQQSSGPHNLNQPKKQQQQQNINNQQNRDNQQQNRNNQQQNQNNRNRNRSRNRNNQQQNWNNQQSQSNDTNNPNGNKRFGNNRNFEAFDYSAVDFRQFQGGAGSANNASNLRTNFKAKNKSKVRGRGLGKGNNKSSFFGMNSNTGRGRR